MTSGTTNHLSGVWGSSSSDVFAVGVDDYGDGAILHYNGSEWAQDVYLSASPLRVWGTSATDVFAVGGDGVIYHRSGGLWRYVTGGAGGSDLVSIWGSSPSDVYTIGGWGNLIHFDGHSWRLLDAGPLATAYWEGNPYYYPWFADAWGSSSSDLFVVGKDSSHENSVFHYDGSSWVTSTSFGHDSASLHGIWGSSASDVFAVGGADDAYVILHYNGSDWSLEDGGYSPHLDDVWGSSSSDVFAVGGDRYTTNGVIYHYNGTSWSPMDSGTASWLAGVWGFSSSDVFAVGSDGTILHYNGSSWSPMASGTTKNLSAIWGSSASNVYAVGSGGTILHYDGSEWSSMSSGTVSDLSAIWGSGLDVFAVGEDCTILHYEGGNEYPNQPVNISPADGATGVSVTPVLQGSTFADAGGDTHLASRWQVRSTTGDYDSPVYDSGSTSPSTSITVPTGELDYSTTYFWRVGYRDSRNLWSSYSLETSFTTADATAIAPVVATVDASGIGSTSATLNLSLTSLGSASSVQVSFEWGPGTAYGSTTTPQTMTSTGAFSYPLTGLSAATTYYFRAKAEGAGIGYGSDLTFTTSAAPAAPPAVSTNAATGTGMDITTLNGALTGLGSAASVQVSFEWGLTAAYGNTTSPAAMAGTSNFNADLSGLAANTTYHFRAKAVGDDTAYGSDMTFTTSATPTTPPAVAAGGAPVIGSLVADNGRPGDDLTVTITGSNLTGATVVAFGEGIAVSEFRVVSDTEITAKIAIGSDAITGKRDVMVTTPSGTGTSPGGFEVSGTGSRVHLWVYLVAGAGGLVVLGALATSLGLLLRRRTAK